MRSATLLKRILALIVGLGVLAGGSSPGGAMTPTLDKGRSSNDLLRPNVTVDGGITDTGYEADVTGFSPTFGGTVTGPGVPAWLRECRWLTWTEADKDAFLASHFGAGQAPGSSRPSGDPDGQWGALFCNPGPEALGFNPIITLTGLLDTWPLDTAPPQLVLDVLIARAYASIEIPIQTGQSAPLGDTNAPMITQLPTWLWVDPTVWAPRTATPPAVFGITVTVTATPVNVTFHGPEGEDINCGPNLGPPYNFNLPDHRQRSNCTLTYHHSSAVGDWTLGSTITWNATYTCSSVCGTGTLPDYLISTTRDVRVAELQAIPIPTPPHHQP